MAKELERDLGLWSVMAISVGAMVGSGIFILPALAMKMSGSAVVLAYGLAAVFVAPAALSKAEMATAMPEAGGTYLYIERGMGPLLGTIAGIGTWFSLTFKSALALVGGAPYIILLFSVRPDLLAVGAALVLIGINLVGVKQTGRLQIVIVAVMLAAIGWFLAGSGGAIDPGGFDRFFEKGPGGILAATGFVYISYAGVTKIASVAEEIENPGRVVPIGMLGSLAFTTLVYVLVVAVIVGVPTGDEIVGSNTPVADVAATTLPEVGVLAVVLAAVLALVSTANAGLLSSSRYPFAMSRDDLAPDALEHVSERFDTPSAAILLTGGVMLVLIWQVPIEDIAKLGSAFKILVFVLVNVALVVFRESDTEAYDPEFRDPLYPWSQTFGIVGGLILLSQIGTVPMVGAVLIVAVSLVWYFAYVRSRIDREGVARGELRRRIGERAIDRTRAAFESDDEGEEVLVAVSDDTDSEQVTALARIGAAVADARNGHLTVVQFDEVPDQLPLNSAREMRSAADVRFEERMREFEQSSDVPVEYGEIVSHDTDHGIANFARHRDVSLLVIEGGSSGVDTGLLGRDVDWISRHAPCDLLLVDVDRLELSEPIALVTDRGPFDPLKVLVADAIAAATDSAVELIRVPDSGPTGKPSDLVDGYHEDLVDLLSVPSRSTRVEDDPSTIETTVEEAGVVVAGSDDSALVRSLGDQLPGRGFGSDCGVVLVQSAGTSRPSPLGRFVERLAF